MTVAALAARVLDGALVEQRRLRPDGDLGGLTARFQRALARSNAAAWLVSTGEDLRYPTTEGARPSRSTRLMQRYLDRVLDVATENSTVNLSFLKVLHMLVPPTALFHPRVLLPVLRGTREQPLTAPPLALVADAAARRDPAASGERAAAVAPSAPDPAGLVHRRADLGDVRLHYVEAGQGPLVVLLHGFPEFWYSWRFQIPALVAAGFRVVAPDMRGFNLSDRPRDVRSYDVAVVSRDVAGLIRACGAERATVVGHDWGGAVAWSFAQRYPAMLDRLVIMNVPHPMRFFESMRTLSQLRKSAYMAVFQLPVIGEAWARHRFVDRALREDPLRVGAFTPQDLERYAAVADRPGGLTGGLNYYRALFRRSPLRSLREIRPIEAPVLVVWGDQDRYIGAELAEPDRRLVPNARVVHVPDASHWIQTDRPERVNELLLAFLAEARSAGPSLPAAAAAG
jgi:pimeloyl-ACP methyl ester carboxylesterase